MAHKGPLVPTAADSFVLKAVVTGERGHLSFALFMGHDVMSLMCRKFELHPDLTCLESLFSRRV